MLAHAQCLGGEHIRYGAGLAGFRNAWCDGYLLAIVQRERVGVYIARSGIIRSGLDWLSIRIESHLTGGITLAGVARHCDGYLPMQTILQSDRRIDDCTSAERANECL